MNWDIMGAWFLFNVMVCVTAVSFAIFLNTKAGEEVEEEPLKIMELILRKWFKYAPKGQK